MSPWLARPRPARIPSVTWELGSMVGALADRPGAFDFVHLSNILDWLDPDEARTTLGLARRALRPGGWTLVRQLNSTLDVERLGDGFEWHASRARRLHQADRSFFYRALHLGRRR
ncbi:MAG: class I SAM-dependent methyltransferase [Gammaproteobacteria bacterium]|nr:class I SAM-dependent methyltransferase [Gammaproteobacteria bacterium]